MVHRDRTRELLTIAASHTTTTALAKPRAAVTSNNTSTQDFLRYAGVVNNNLTAVSEMLTKLSELVKQRNVFDDHTAEIADMTHAVQSQLDTVKDNMTTLNRLKQKTADGGKAHKTEAERHTEAVVGSLQRQFKDVGLGFQRVLQLRSDDLKGRRDRRQRFSATVDDAAISAHDGTEDLSVMLRLHTPNHNLEYYKSRASDVMRVEKSIHELGDLFREFARLVHEQEEEIVSIDEQVEEAKEQVELGTRELQRYFRRISKDGNLVLKIFAVLFAFIMLFGFFIL